MTLHTELHNMRSNSALLGEQKYSDKQVRVSVCSHISEATCANFTKSATVDPHDDKIATKCYLQPWFLWQHCDYAYSSCSVDDVKLSHNGLYGGILLPCSIVNVDGLMLLQCSNWWQPVLHDDDQMSPLCKKCWRRVCNHHHHRFNMHECSMNNKIHDKPHKMIQKDIIQIKRI